MDVRRPASFPALRRQRRLHGADHPDYPRDAAHLVLARLLIAQDQPDAALALLDRLHSAAAAGQQRTASTIEIQTLRAIALSAHDAAAASSALAEALVLGHPEGHLRVFVDEGEPIAALVARSLADRGVGADGAVPVGYLRQLVGEFDRIRDEQAAPGGAANAGLVVPLTERELDVLQMLADGRSNQAIADELYLALNTVKHHVTHILDKVGAANRTAAVARARELGLLS